MMYLWMLLEYNSKLYYLTSWAGGQLWLASWLFGMANNYKSKFKVSGLLFVPLSKRNMPKMFIITIPFRIEIKETTTQSLLIIILWSKTCKGALNLITISLQCVLVQSLQMKESVWLIWENFTHKIKAEFNQISQIQREKSHTEMKMRGGANQIDLQRISVFVKIRISEELKEIL